MRFYILQLRRQFWVLKITGCFYSTITSYMSKDQGNFDFSVHDPFNKPSVMEAKTILYIVNSSCLYPYCNKLDSCQPPKGKTSGSAWQMTQTIRYICAEVVPKQNWHNGITLQVTYNCVFHLQIQIQIQRGRHILVVWLYFYLHFNIVEGPSLHLIVANMAKV